MLDSEALKMFSAQPVSHQMVEFLAATTSSVLRLKPAEITPSQVGLLVITPKTVSLTHFIRRLIDHSHVRTATLMGSLVYLNRLRNALPGNATGHETSLHRIFLASLILSAKTLNDSSPLNKHWTVYTDGLLSNAEVNAAERDLIALLKWDLNVRQTELETVLQPFLVPIKKDILARRNNELRTKQEYYRMSSLNSIRSLASLRSSSKNSIFSASNYSLASARSSDEAYLRSPLREKPRSALNRASVVV